MITSSFWFDPTIVQNPRFDILHDTTLITFNDVNLKPHWVEHPAKFTEFHIQRNKKNLLIMIGESWTYGETLPGIATGIQKYNFESQLEFCVGSRLAVTLDTDLYQYAVPGNCNFYMFTELDRILKHVSTLGYKKIYVCAQMTEPSREQPIVDQLTAHNHKLANHIHPSEKITFNKWLEVYDDIFFDQYENIINQYDNLECSLWKNFCKINSKNVNRKFKIIDKTWIQYSASILGKKINAPSFYSINWLDSIVIDYQYSNIVFDKSDLLSEMDLIEKSNAFINANSLHSNHPSNFGHLLWAQYLAKNAGWNNDI